MLTYVYGAINNEEDTEEGTDSEYGTSAARHVVGEFLVRAIEMRV
jgi:hypothetical protein